MSLRRATGRSTAWAFIGYLGHYAVTFAFTVVTARLLSPEVFGIMGLSVVVIAVGTLLADSGTQAALIHRKDDLDVAINTALISVPLTGLGAALLGVAAAPLLAWFYDESQVLPVAALLSGVLFVRSFGLVSDAILQRNLDFKMRRAVVDPLAAAVGGATATVLALMGAGVWSLVAMWYANTITMVVGSWMLTRYRPRLGLANFQTWRELASYGRSILGAHTVQLAFGYLDTATIGRNLGSASVGWYGAATRLAILPAQATTYVAGAALFPAFTRMASDIPRLRSAFLEAVRYIALLAFPLLAALAVISEPFVVVLFGEQWRPAGPALAVMMLWILPLSLLEPAMELFKSIGRPGLVFQLSLLKFAVFGGYLGALWALDEVTLIRVAAGLGLSVGVALAVTVPIVSRALDTPLSRLWTAVRPALIAALVSVGGMYLLSEVVMGDIETHTSIGGLGLGPLLPLLLMGAVTALGFSLFVVTAETVERGCIRALLAQAKLVTGRS
ncbi:MAG: oligosaccharide flippase family protein [Thermoleophilia bacterium]|nr:oligosaccharide flippase family protein [Thermoleophilia bacterium]